LFCILVLNSLRAAILFLLRRIPDPDARNRQEECWEPEVEDSVAEELEKHVSTGGWNRKRPEGRYKTGITNGSILEAVTPTLSHQDSESLDTLSEAIADIQPLDSLDAAPMGSTITNINVINAVMPSPATLGTAPHFKGENISAFLESWDNFAGDYDCVGAEKRKKILRYVDPFYRDEIRFMTEYAEHDKPQYDEQAFYKALLKKYRDTDHEYLKYSRQFLLALVAQARDGKVEPKEYIYLYHRISTRLHERNLLGDVERATLFLNGLPKEIVSKVVEAHNVDQSDAQTINYQKFYKTALA
jgi:hypothetical protein